MPITTISPLATPVPHPRDVKDRKVTKAWGVCVHTTGRGVPTKALKLGITPEEVAISIYLAPDNPSIGLYTNFPHYVIGSTKGEIIQIADEKERARHCAISDSDRALYLNGKWESKVSKVGLSFWKKKWHFKNPLQMFPGTSINDVYIGIEIIPYIKPFSNGSLFSKIQYDSLWNLIKDIEVRHGTVFDGTHLVGHEDLSPLTRWDNNGGYDPGALRNNPYFTVNLDRSKPFQNV